MPGMDQRPVTLALAGCGNRGSVYAAWAAEHPERARVVAVADPRAPQRQAIAERHGVPPKRQFSSWQELAAAGPRADAVIVTTQDAEHVQPTLAFAERGYHLMVEKPLAPTEAECTQMVEAVTRAGVLFAVGHVLRYQPYTRALREVLDSGRIGEIVNVQHLEPVGYWHQAHSFVRGNWRNTDESSFMLLAKSCHDIDWLRYVVGTPITRVSSFGSLRHFRPEHAPAGAADRCLECAVEPDCAYSAKRIYLGFLSRGQTNWPVSVITDDVSEAGVLKALREGPYGRCVYACDNDVVDHQVVAAEFEGGVTATFTMTAFSEAAHRRTQIFGTQGRIDGDGEQLRVLDFATDEEETIEANAAGAHAGAGHGGGDAGLMDAFTTALARGDASYICSGPAETLESHLAVFAAERARLSGTVEPVTVPLLSA